MVENESRAFRGTLYQYQEQQVDFNSMCICMFVLIENPSIANSRIIVADLASYRKKRKHNKTTCPQE